MEIELLDPKIKEIKPSEDMNKNFNENTLSLKENFTINIHNYGGLIIVFASTLIVFPVLAFKLDFYLPSYIQYAYISLVFNFADILSRYVYLPYPLDNKSIIDALSGFKVMLVYIVYMSAKAEFGILTYHVIRFLLIFSIGFLNGYLCMCYIDLSTKNFTSIYDRNRAGYLINTSIQIGLTIGALLSTLW